MLHQLEKVGKAGRRKEKRERVTTDRKNTEKERGELEMSGIGVALGLQLVKEIHDLVIGLN